MLLICYKNNKLYFTRLMQHEKRIFAFFFVLIINCKFAMVIHPNFNVLCQQVK